MGCGEFYRDLERLMEGENCPEALAHAACCPACAGLIQDLRVITRESRLLDEFEPSPQVWASLRGRLKAEGLMGPSGWLERLRGWFERLVPLASSPAFSAVYVVVLLLGLGLIFSQIEVSNTPDVGQSLYNLAGPAEKAVVGNGGYEKQLAQLEHSALENAALNSPELRAAYVRNLATLDEAIRSCKDTLKEDPNDPTTRQYLYAAYQQKAAVLQSLLDPDLM